MRQRSECDSGVYRSRSMTVFTRVLCIALAGAVCFAQVQPAAPAAQEQQVTGVHPDYRLGPGDELSVRVSGLDDLSDPRVFRVSSDGFLSLPAVGLVRVAGLTLDAAERELTTQFRQYIVNPHVALSIVQFRPEPVFFAGAFKNPGIHYLRGRRTLVEMLSNAGGLAPNATRRIRVTRRNERGQIPLSNVIADPDGKTNSIEINIGNLRDTVDPAIDIVLEPFDVISADRAEMVYVTGEVNKVGGLELGDRNAITITQAIALSGGLTRDADVKGIRILRPVLNSNQRAEIPIDLKSILRGAANDFPILPNDVLFVPRSGSRAFWSGMAMIALPSAIALSVVFTQ